MTKQLVCFKCGSKKIDDGTTPLFVLLGGALIAAATCVIYCATSTDVMASMEMGSDALDWNTFVPATHVDCGVIFGICLGIVMLIQGMQRTERVRCRDCGSVFTPPKPRVLKPYHADR
jgi:DNA-directed RNA polymerase subunit RPC12/RpoP